MRKFIMTDLALVSIINAAINATIDKLDGDHSINPWKKAKERLDEHLTAGKIAAVGAETKELMKIWG